MNTVMVVDSEGNASSALVRHLEQKGYRAVPSKNGREVSDAIDREAVDAIVLRVRPAFDDRRAMNGLGGFVWALAAEHDIPLIVTTDRRRDVPRLQQWHLTAFAEQEEPAAVDVALRHALRHRRTRRLPPVAG